MQQLTRGWLMLPCIFPKAAIWLGQPEPAAAESGKSFQSELAACALQMMTLP